MCSVVEDGKFSGLVVFPSLNPVKTVHAGARVWPDVKLSGPREVKGTPREDGLEWGFRAGTGGIGRENGRKITYTGTGGTGKYTRSQFFQCLRWKLQVHREKKLGSF